MKHIFDGHVVLQYNCTNTIPEQLLEQTFVAFEKPEGVIGTDKFSNLLKFIVKE
ncbi:Coatomer subunit gamma, partial [Zea mays]